MELSSKLLKEIYRYDGIAGKLYYRVKTASRVIVGDEVGSYNDGYLQTQLFGKMLKVHRIIWKMEHDENPEQVDHINHIRNDNRIENLRNVSSQVNMMNLSKSKRNKLGINGVYEEKIGSKIKYVSSIRVNGKILGKKRFDTIGEAVEHRNYLYDKHGFHENHGI